MPRAALLAVALLALACGPPAPADDEAPSPLPEPVVDARPAEAAHEPPPVPPDDGRPLVVFLGDSLTAGYGLDPDEAFPAVVAERLAAEGLPIRVVNAGVSGDTTAGGASRLAWLLAQEPDVLVVALGANDGLRGLPLAASEANLRAIVSGARAASARVLLAGMLVPPNYGPEYAERFREIFPRVAAEAGVPLVPFLLAEVAARPELNLGDGIHPNAAGHRRVAETVLPYLRELLVSPDSPASAPPPPPPPPAPGA